MNDTSLAALTNVFGISGISELLQLKSGLRQVFRISAPRNKENELLELSQKLHLSVVRSVYPVSANSQCCRFEKDIETDAAVYLYYIANDEASAFLASTSESINPELHGTLFGYPACCIRFFQQHISGIADDLTLSVLPDTTYNFLINRTAKTLGYSLISHFPCSWNCLPSVALAAKTLAAMQNYAPEFAGKLTGMLCCNVFYSPECALFLKPAPVSATDTNQKLFAVYGKTPTKTVLKSDGKAVYVHENNTWKHLKNWRYFPFADNNPVSVCDTPA